MRYVDIIEYCQYRDHKKICTDMCLFIRDTEKPNTFDKLQYDCELYELKSVSPFEFFAEVLRKNDLHFSSHFHVIHHSYDEYHRIFGANSKEDTGPNTMGKSHWVV